MRAAKAAFGDTVQDLPKLDWQRKQNVAALPAKRTRPVWMSFGKRSNEPSTLVNVPDVFLTHKPSGHWFVRAFPQNISEYDKFHTSPNLGINKVRWPREVGLVAKDVVRTVPELKMLDR